MIDLDSCEKMAIKEAEPMVADMVKNVPEAQKAEASDWVMKCIAMGIVLMKAQVFTEEMVED